MKTPYYYKPAYKPEVLIAHYRRVADESPIPVLLYSVPIFTGLALEAPETIALAEHQNIIGIKDSSGNVQRISEMIAGAPAQFQVLVGAAATVFPCLAVGARGAILALASALPEKCATLYELFRQGQMGTSARAAKGVAAGLQPDCLEVRHRGGQVRYGSARLSRRQSQVAAAAAHRGA